MVPRPQKTEGATIAYASTAVPGPATAEPAPPTPHREPPLKTPEAASYLGISESWLRQSRMAGRMAQPPPWHCLGRAVRYFRHELDSWLARRTPCGAQGQPAPQALPATEPRPAKSKPGSPRKAIGRHRSQAISHASPRRS
jgi:predicted DNA-binding transcriptional regulator AlpA